jgi:GTP-binding protein HflX
MKNHSSSPAAAPARRAIVLSAFPAAAAADRAVSQRELVALAELLNIEVVGELHQLRESPHHDTYVGSGKTAELEGLLEAEAAEVLLVDDELTPRQHRGLGQLVDGLVVLDRTDVVLQTFEARATTPLARLEVEIARITYELPRVREDRALGDKEGGGGRGGRGNSNVEIAKQNMRNRASELKRKREELLGKPTATQPGARRVALVGYTNAGKSTWLRALTGAEVLVADQLFATLATTTRRLPGVSPAAVISDTVGFMQRLPHGLVASFHATLSDAAHADLLVIVLDAADDGLPIHLAVVEETLALIDAGERPRLVVLNKWDAATPLQRARARAHAPGGLELSALDQAAPEKLTDAIRTALAELATPLELFVPWRRHGELAAHLDHLEVVKETHEEDGTRLMARASPAMVGWLKKTFGPAPASTEP